MKSKIIISLILAVLMLATLATPALAARPHKADLFERSTGGTPIPDTETGSVSLQLTHDNHVKITVVLKGVTPGQSYQVYCSTGGFMWGTDSFIANSRGSAKFRGVSTNPVTIPWGAWVYVRVAGSGTTDYMTPYISL